MRASAAIAVAVIIGTGLLPALPAGSRSLAVGVAAPPYADVPAWFVGDVWTYATHAVQRSPNGSRTDTTTVIDTQVVELRTETVRGTWYTLYNATTSGTLVTAGVISVPGVGTYPFSLAGTMSGWSWTDRSNLAVVATNTTAVASGLVDLPFPLPDAPIDVDGAVTQAFLPAQEELDFPLELDDGWRYNVTVNTTGYAHYRVQSVLGTIDNTTDLTGASTSATSFWFNGTEDVTVPAGSFPASARIHAIASGGAASDRWYHPAAKNLAKLETHLVNAPNDYLHVWVNLTASPPSPPPWPGTIVLTPQRVGAGEALVASGTANPDESLTVSVPAIPMTYVTTADSSGAWSLPIVAPGTDDGTPANADVGSHGVIVDAAGSAGWAVATLQLAPPDLYAIDAELTLAATPVAGIPVAVNGTVHAGAAAAVGSAFNVSFTVDGSEIQRYAVAGMPAAGSSNFTALWVPTPGWHAVAFTADPDGAISETDEGNNTASRTVFVPAPDLVPVDILVEADTTDVYPDPAAVGYVSRPAQGRINGTVNVTFDVENVGGAAANASVVVEVVETDGLRGRPRGPPILRVPVPMPLLPGTRAGPYPASWPVPATPGVYHLNVTVDASGQLEEESEANNTFVLVVNVSGPDYRIVSAAVPPKATAGSAHRMDVTIRNEGQLAGDRDVVLAAFQGGSPLPFATATVPALAVLESATVPISWTAPSTAGVVSLSFVADANDVLDEMIETNNDASGSVDVRLPPVTTISWTGTNVTTTTLFVTSAARFSLAAVDRSDTTVSSRFRIDAGAEMPFAAPFGLVGEGAHATEYWSEDGLGGEEVHQTLEVSVDDSPPDASGRAGAQRGADQIITLNATDGPAGVGVARIEYRVDGGPWLIFVGPFNVSGYGEHNVTLRAVDLLGHVGPEEQLVFVIMRRGPPPIGLGNIKPPLALAFAMALLLAGRVFGRGREERGLTSPRALGFIFAAAEGATGVLSLGVRDLAIPPFGLGLALDLVILVAGLLTIWFRGRVVRGTSTASPSEKPDAPLDSMERTDK